MKTIKVKQYTGVVTRSCTGIDFYLGSPDGNTALSQVMFQLEGKEVTVIIRYEEDE